MGLLSKAKNVNAPKDKNSSKDFSNQTAQNATTAQAAADLNTTNTVSQKPISSQDSSQSSTTLPPAFQSQSSQPQAQQQTPSLTQVQPQKPLEQTQQAQGQLGGQSQSQTSQEKPQPSQDQITVEVKRSTSPSSNSSQSNSSGPVDKDDARKQLLSLAQGQPIKTVVDDVVDFIAANGGKQRFDDITRQFKLSTEALRKYTDLLSKHNVIAISYPLNVFASAHLVLKPATGSETQESRVKDPKRKLLESYTVKADNVVADVNVWSVPSENTPIYEILPHRLMRGTEAILSELVEVMSQRIPLGLNDITNPRRVLEMRNTFYDMALSLINEYFTTTDQLTKGYVAGILVHRTYGLGDIEVLMADNWLEEVAINGSSEPISLYHKKYGWLKTTVILDKEDEIYNFAAQISRRVGKQINALNPIMDAHLQTGDRVAATLFPISTEGDTITIRRFSRNPWTVAHMIDPKVRTMSSEILALLWQAVQYELNYMVVGGTASGKTSVLNTLGSLIPPTNRVISIEDTREITLPQALHWNWVPLASKSANTEGQGEVTMLDLMVASLRMRPDRIIVGEIRRKQQAEAMFEAMHTGHSVCATMHADTAEQIKRRLTQPPIDIPENEIQALQLVVVQYRDRRLGVRRTLEVAELLPGASGEKVNLNYLYRWRARSDEFYKENESIRLIEDLNLHTGMTQRELDEDIQQKKEILEWISKNNLKDVDAIGNIMSIYYKFPKIVLDTVKDNGSVNNLLGQ